MNKIIIASALLALAATSGASLAGGASPEAVQKVVASSWKEPNTKNPEGAKPDWASRLGQDNLPKACSATPNPPAKDPAEEIVADAKASVKFPEDGKLLGDWKNGEKIAQDGRGQRYNDKVGEPAGGNCYACHQIDKKELAFGTIGPSLAEYGKLRDFKEDAVKATYEKIFNSHSTLACSNMPRFGAQGILTIEQIKDVTALLMDKESPVNK